MISVGRVITAMLTCVDREFPRPPPPASSEGRRTSRSTSLSICTKLSDNAVSATALRCIVAVLLAVSAAACTEDTIVLATVPASDAGQSPSPNIRCVESSECGEGSFCDRINCTLAAGTCQPFPKSCDDQEHPVCGCDGVTYFNDCLRRAAGVPGARDQECGSGGVLCGEGAATCPQHATCAFLLGLRTGPNCHMRWGQCWALPAQCPPAARVDRWDECSPDPNPLHCLDTCAAIRTGKTFTRAFTCQ
jgi:hypothetical protein